MNNKININLADYYNQHTTIDETLNIIMKEFKGMKRHDDNLVIEYNKGELVTLISCDIDEFVVEDDNPMNWEVGTVLTHFEIFARIRHNRMYSHALSELIIKYEQDSKLMRISDKYYELLMIPDIDGVWRTEPHLRQKTEVVQDYGKEILNYMPKYSRFVMKPNNVDFKINHDGCYNVYQEFSHTPVPCTDISEIPWSMAILKHLWTNAEVEWKIALTYMQCLYLHPRVKLPVLCLVSKENATGKTTFANWLQMIFGSNSTSIGTAQLSGSFTDSFGDKNIIVIEETQTDDKSFMANLKQFSTAKRINQNKKGMPEYSVDFFGKFIVLSNFEDNFMKITDQDVRYWVLKVPVLTEEMANHGILEDLKAEIPKFLGYLAQLPPVDFTRDRMVFTPKETKTKQLERTRIGGKSGLYEDLKEGFKQYFFDFPDQEQVCFALKDAKELMFKHNSKYMPSDIKKCITEEIGVAFCPRQCGRYQPPFFYIDGATKLTPDYYAEKRNGDFYTITKNSFREWKNIKWPDINNMDVDSEPIGGSNHFI